MVKLQIPAILVSLLLFMTGCDEKDTGPDISSLKLTISKNRIVGDAIDVATVTVSDQNGKDVIDLVTIYFDGKVFPGKRIYSLTPTKSTVYAAYGSIKSNEVQLEVVEDKNLKFEKNVLVEQYTGTWCGWCPRAVDQISILQKTDKRIVHASHHLSDEMTYNYNISLFQASGFKGIPTVHADREIDWKGDVSVISGLHAPSRIGIYLEVTGTTAQIKASVSIKFGYDFAENLKLSVYLLHDSLIANQANYYNTDTNSPYYNKGNPMVSFIHKNVMIKSGTDMFGDLIPSSSVDIGSVYTKNVEFTSFRCEDIRKMIIVALVTIQTDNQAGRVLNSIKASVGEKKDFVYAGK